jgi:hypothetical protein
MVLLEYLLRFQWCINSTVSSRIKIAVSAIFFSLSVKWELQKIPGILMYLKRTD